MYYKYTRDKPTFNTEVYLISNIPNWSWLFKVNVFLNTYNSKFIYIVFIKYLVIANNIL